MEEFMPRIDTSMLQGLGGASERTQRAIIDEVVDVIVLSDVTVFEESVAALHELYDMRWGMFHQNIPFPVTRDQLIRYCYTAVRSRVARVNNERFHTRCDDPWAVPTPIAAALAGIGMVSLESPHMVIVPRWDEAHDGMLLTHDEQRIITQRLRAVERDGDVKLLFARAISGDKSGDEALMALVPIRDANGRVVELQSRTDFDPIAGLVYLLMGLEPSIITSAPALPMHPLLMPPVYIRAAALLQQMHRFVEAGAA
jgi:hypothetical protein